MTKLDSSHVCAAERGEIGVRLRRLALGAVLVLTVNAMGIAAEHSIRVERLLDRPIITPDTHPSIGENIQGPSLIRVPDWVSDSLGKYY